jgi:hypothetical protein
MPLLGKGVAAIWHNVDAAVEADYNHWHCHEHMAERLSIPGFLRGRRYVAIEAERKFFHFYETADRATLTSPAYLGRLNAPTPWTRRIGPSIRDNNRTLAEVAASLGVGGGAAILTLRLGAEVGAADRLSAYLGGELAPALVQGPGVVGAHLLRGDRTASQVQSAEKAMRAKADEVADWVYLVEAIEPEFLTALRREALSDAALAARGSTAVVAGLYRLHYTLDARELGLR